MFWSIFEKLCSDHNTTPNGVAKKLELSNATTTKWKNGATPSGKSLQKVADYFHVSVDYLLGNEPAVTPEEENAFMQLFSELTAEEQMEIVQRMLEMRNKK